MVDRRNPAQDRDEARRWDRIQTIFRQIVDLPMADRHESLQSACGEDGELRRDVEELLEADGELRSEPGDFIAATVGEGERLLSVTEPEPRLPSRLGKYEVKARLGTGGFGVVYEGHDPLLRRSVAIKVCSSADEEVRKRFYREGRIAAGLRHSNITTVHELAVHEPAAEEGQPFLVQELLDGEDLRDVIADGRPLPFETLIRYLAQIARGLEHAHRSGVLHRDVKPANIRILPDGTVKLMDFGIAKLLGADTGLTVTGTTMGTVGYLAPEQLRSEDLDERADIFSFGVVAYELLAGKRPFRGDDFSQTSYQLLYVDPDPLLNQCPECPLDLAKLVHRCLAKEAIERPGSLVPVLAELESLVARLQDSASSRGPISNPESRGWLSTTSGSFGTSWTRLSVRDVGPPLAGFLAVSLVLWIAFSFSGVSSSGPDPIAIESEAGKLEHVAIGTSSTEPPFEAESQLLKPRESEDSSSTSTGSEPEMLIRDTPDIALQKAAPETERSQVLAPEHKASETRSPRAGALEAGALEAGALESGALESGALEAGALESGALEAGAFERSAGESVKLEPAKVPKHPGEEQPEVLSSDHAMTAEPGNLAPRSVVPMQEMVAGSSASDAPTPTTSTPTTSTFSAIPAEARLEEGHEDGAPAQSAMIRGDLITGEGPGVDPPRLVQRPQPKYPRRARRRHIEEQVMVKVLVGENGDVLQVLAPGKDEHGFLKAARDSALAATFLPANRDGIPGRMWINLSFDFSLESQE